MTDIAVLMNDPLCRALLHRLGASREEWVRLLREEIDRAAQLIADGKDKFYALRDCGVEGEEMILPCPPPPG